MLGEHATEESIQAFRERMGLNEPVHIQYLRYMRDFARFDLGRSITTNRPVTEEIALRFPATAELSLWRRCSLPVSLASLPASSLHIAIIPLSTSPLCSSR